MKHHKLSEIIAERVSPCVAPETTVVEALDEMRANRHGAVLVIDDGALKGIFTTGNLMRRVVEAGLNPATAKVVEVMTPEPLCLHCDCQGFDAVKMMEDNAIRHLAVHGLGDTGGGYSVICLDDFPDSELKEYEDELAFEQRLWEEM